MYINTFQLGGGGHIGFLNFEAFAAIFELGIQKIWTQHPSIPLKSFYAATTHNTRLEMKRAKRDDIVY